MPGVEIHAQVLESALTGAVMSQPNYGIASNSSTALLFGLLVIAFAPNVRAGHAGRPRRAFATVLIGTSWYFYTQHRLLIDFTYPLMSTTAIYLTLIFSSFVREQAQRRRSARRSASICRRRWSSSWRSRRKSSCSAARSAR
jgi:adenylate cyclase